MNKLKLLRKKIDTYDSKIVRLLNLRAQAALNIGKLKKKSGGSFYLPHREKEVLRKVKRLSSVLSQDAVAEVYDEILNVCRNLQKKLVIGYFGPEATFTHQAAQKNFGMQAEYFPAPSISEVFELVEREQVDYGVVPIENSTEGIVTHTLDMFRSSDLKIVMEIKLAVHHCLLSKCRNVANIKRIYSHQHAFPQCSGYIKRNLHTAEFVEVSSTAEAAKKASQDAHGAAIASQLAGKLYKLPIVAKRIEDLHNNVTRFLVIGRDIAQSTGQDKTSILFAIKDRVGALHDILNPFKRMHINMTKIESRPEKGKAWNYIFYVDFEGHIKQEKIRKLIKTIDDYCKFVKILGSYPMAE
ncbi:MAG: prephenate dehydratase [bacterium]